MRALHACSLVCALAAVSLLVFGAPAFSAMEADRAVTTSSAEDEHAYLGLQHDAPVTVSGDEDATLLTATNQFANDLDTVDVTIEDVTVHSGDQDLDVSIVDQPDALALSERGDVVVTAAGDEDTLATVTVDILASGATEETSLTRDVDIQYETDGATAGFWFAGLGQFHVTDGTGSPTVPADDTYDVTVYTVDEAGEIEPRSGVLDPTEHRHVKQAIDPPRDSPVVGVYVDDVGSLLHPAHEVENGTYVFEGPYGAGDAQLVTDDELDPDDLTFHPAD